MLLAALVQTTTGPVPPWRPFLSPLPLGGGSWWLTLVPLALLIAVVYKAVRVPDMRRYAVNVLVMALQIVVTMALLALGFQIFVLWIVPALGG